MGPRGLGRGATAATMVLLAIGASGAKAATLTVTTTNDELNSNGQCSLREAIAAVDAPNTATDCGRADNAGNTIVLGASEYLLSIQRSGADDNSTGDLDVQGTTGLTIVGAGTGSTVIAGALPPTPSATTGLKDRLLRVASGSITLQNLTLRDGRSPDGADGVSSGISGLAPTAGQPGLDGGAISNSGSVSLDHVALINNSAGKGGTGGNSVEGIAGSGGGANGGNGGHGGGIYNAPSAVLNLTDVTMSGNRSGNGGNGGGADGTGSAGGNGGCCGDGGGLFNDGGTVQVTASTFSQNIAGDGGSGGSGGDPQSGSPGNGGSGQGGSSGGAIATAGGSLTVTSSTIAGNLSGSGGNGGSGGVAFPSGSPVFGAVGTAGNGSAGGGIFARTGSNVTLTNVTIAQNQSGGPGSGTPSGPNSGAQAAGVFVNSATVTAHDTLLASNSVGNCGGPTTVTDGGNNLSFAGGGCPGTFLTGDPRLGPLQDNGGPTPTMDLGGGSAAIDKGAGCPSTDQRGAARPSGPACDIGAYEVTPPAAATGPALSISSSGATLNGTATANQSSASVTFDYGTTSSYGQSAPAGPQPGGFSPTGVSALIGGLAPNTTYHYRLVVTSPDGTAVGSDQTFTTAPGPAGTTVGTTPSLGRLSLKPSSFRTAKRRHHPHDKVGTTLSYTDSQAGTTTFTVFRCTKVKKRRCVRYVRVGSFSRKGSAGRNSFHWSGSIGRTRLKPGRYRLDGTARIGRLTTNIIRVVFTVVR